MNIQDFAEANRLRVTRDPEDGSYLIRGNDGLIYEFDGSRLGVMVLGEGTKKWGYRRERCLKAGMDLLQDGDEEGTCLFDPLNPLQIETAIEVADVKRKRRITEGVAASLEKATEVSPLIVRVHEREKSMGL